MKDYNLKYNYVYFNANYLGGCNADKNEFNAICLRDAEDMKDVKIVPCPLYDKSHFLQRLYLWHNSHKGNKYSRILFKKIWYPLFCDLTDKNEKPYCFVVAALPPFDYLKYLRKRFPNCRMVKLHRDLVKITHGHPAYSEENMNKMFDFRMTYDEKEAEKYGMLHFDGIESKIHIGIDENYPLSDVFFAGRAKDRLAKIIKAYDIFENHGLKCDFYITHVRKSEQVQRRGITYLDNYMPYIEMLYKTVNSRCVLDISQQGAVGYNARVLDGIIYNKRMILDNKSVQKMKYYNPDYMQIFDSADDIDPQFVLNKAPVDYCYQNDFSPTKLICQIDNELVKRFGN